MTKRTTLRIGLPWHSINSSNLGLGALTECQLDLIQGIADELSIEVTFEVLFWPDRTEPYVERSNLLFCAFSKEFLISPWKGMLSYARRCDVVFDIAGGDSFTDQYGVRRFLFQALTKAVVIIAGTPLVLSPQTIGPFERRWARKFSSWLMRRSRSVVARDSLSSDFVRELGAEPRLIEATDVAMRLPYDVQSFPESSKVRVGVNISGLLFRGGYDKRNYFGLAIDYVELTRALLDRLSARPEVEIHLIGHVILPLRFESVDDDYRVALQLGEEYGDAVVAPPFANPSEAKSYIAGMDLFTGSRMHACIAAFSAGVPVVPMAYSRKFRGLFSTLGYSLVADCLKDSVDEILAKVEYGFDNRPQLAETVAACNASARIRLLGYDDLVRDCLCAAAGIER